LCTNTCQYSGDALCDDGGPQSYTDSCSFSTDCSDCTWTSLITPYLFPIRATRPDGPAELGKVVNLTADGDAYENSDAESEQEDEDDEEDRVSD
jgi:hypothetical protein